MHLTLQLRLIIQKHHNKSRNVRCRVTKNEVADISMKGKHFKKAFSIRESVFIIESEVKMYI